ncbi:DUF6485 family protein [Vallitalea okinawensis]|uniref:DUF6485 family protein n=1 Tax=Vallitalea okinawensis TaxID=2078660 RepID=UPI000CFC95B3|nr:DUF6485 family protein [Vallitalea okinawensis]
MSCQKDCRCTQISCPRHGNCCQCVSHHRDRNELPGCFFTPEGEKTYDRSIHNYLKDLDNRK